MNLIREIRSAGGQARQRARHTFILYYYHRGRVGSRENATVAKHAVMILHRTDIRTHGDGWVVVDRHKDTTHDTRAAR